MRYIFLPSNAEMRLRILHALDKPVDKLTVSEICQASGVSRQTFYRNFASKYDIAFWFLGLIDSLYLGEIGRSLSWTKGHELALSMLYEEHDYLKFAFAENPDVRAVEKRLKIRYETVIETLQDFKKAHIDDELLYFARFYVFTGEALIVEWCLSNTPYPPAIFKKYFSACMPERLRNLLNEPAAPVTRDQQRKIVTTGTAAAHAHTDGRLSCAAMHA
ncbi:hypothetical protein C1878_15450 [Gordonibacter sp. 28C]|uniref:TetR/AcrR family transcriptional regulator n=1 Tax=Gordonibacter sp. 28C TaxID=2078569 RepID=UPI000DF8013F|nr:TetR/AcrR family transcriptional regulator [Gordonibacter sp. 28C]RDB59296.1 hypothetical protein C1878_15450 [Gordonibacter sp. 28C]